MDLEIADYERTVEALNNTIAEKDKIIEENKGEIDLLEDRVKTLKEQIGEIFFMEVGRKIKTCSNYLQQNIFINVAEMIYQSMFLLNIHKYFVAII